MNEDKFVKSEHKESFGSKFKRNFPLFLLALVCGAAIVLCVGFAAL